MNEFLAKSNPIETIQQHTNELIKQYNILKEKYPHILKQTEWELLYLAALYHDFGKMNVKFQNKISKAINNKNILKDDLFEFEEIPHNYISPAFLNKQKIINEFDINSYKILILAIFFHHARRPIVVSDLEYIKKTIEFIKKEAEKFEYNNIEISVNSDYLKYILGSKSRLKTLKENWNNYFKIKGLLNRLDYVASSGINEIEENIYDEDNEVVSDKVIKYFKRKKYKLNELQKFMFANKNKNLIVTAPTGMGKTEASLLWFGDKKAFFTLPLKVSINAIYNRINYEIMYKKVSLLHSDSLSVYVNDNKNNMEFDESIDYYKKTKLLASPLTVTTVDQLFKFVYKYNGSESILSTLMYSKVLIDEVQMYSAELVAYILTGLKTIENIGGQFAIVTATLPPLFIDFLEELEINFNNLIIKDFTSSKEVFDRHRICLYKNEFEGINTELVEKLAIENKVLVIVNTVKNAQKLYENLKVENKKLLHSNFIKKDRKELEDEIIKFTNDKEFSNENGIRIATQIVEASLDIDFDILFTEMTSVDSLFQRFGRVYRKREYSLKEPNIYIYDNRNTGGGKIIDNDIYDFSVEVLSEYNNMIITESEKRDIINAVFNVRKNDKLVSSMYYKTINETINYFKNLDPYTFEKKEAEKYFRNIDSVTIIPSEVYNNLQNEGLVDKWKTILMDKKVTKSEKYKIKMEINEYTISVSHYWKYDINFEKHLFYYMSHIFICNNDYYYKDENKLGLVIKDKSKITTEYDNFI